MAEIGAAANAIAIASIIIQVGDSILKLKTFWDSVKEAPEEIKWMIENLETLSLVLSEVGINDDEFITLPRKVGTRCLELCRQAADKLEATAKDLHAAIGRRKIVGGFKAVLKKGTIEMLKGRLRSAQMLLILSNQTYSDALQKHCHEIQRQWAEFQQHQIGDLRSSVVKSANMTLSPPSQSTNPLVNSAANELEDNMSRRMVARARKSHTNRQRSLIRLGGLRWLFLTSRALELSGSKAPSGWDFSFRLYNIVSKNSPLIKLIRNGNIDGVQELFRQRKATPFDVTEKGKKLLHFAVKSKSLAMCQFRVDQGADNKVETIKHCAFFSASDLFDDYQAVLRLLAQVTDFDRYVNVDIVWDISWLNALGLELFTLLMQLSESSFQSDSFQERILAVECLIMYKEPVKDAARMIQYIIGEGFITPSTCNIATIGKETSLIHCVAWSISAIVDTARYDSFMDNIYETREILPSAYPPDSSAELLIMLRELILAGSKLHGFG